MINQGQGVCLVNNELMKKALDNFKNRDSIYDELAKEFKEKMKKDLVWGTLFFIPLKMSKWEKWLKKYHNNKLFLNARFTLEPVCKFMLQENFITKEESEEITRCWNNYSTYSELRDLCSVSDQCYVTPKQASFINYWSQEE